MSRDDDDTPTVFPPRPANGHAHQHRPARCRLLWDVLGSPKRRARDRISRLRFERSSCASLPSRRRSSAARCVTRGGRGLFSGVTVGCISSGG
jgi:hypothetical protein